MIGKDMKIVFCPYRAHCRGTTQPRVPSSLRSYSALGYGLVGLTGRLDACVFRSVCRPYRPELVGMCLTRAYDLGWYVAPLQGLQDREDAISLTTPGLLRGALAGLGVAAYGV